MNCNPMIAQPKSYSNGKIRVELSLMEALKLRPKLWERMNKEWNNSNRNLGHKTESQHNEIELREVCKINQYIKAEGEKENTSLKLKVNGGVTSAMLDKSRGKHHHKA